MTDDIKVAMPCQSPPERPARLWQRLEAEQRGVRKATSCDERELTPPGAYVQHGPEDVTEGIRLVFDGGRTAIEQSAAVGRHAKNGCKLSSFGQEWRPFISRPDAATVGQTNDTLSGTPLQRVAPRVF